MSFDHRAGRRKSPPADRARYTAAADRDDVAIAIKAHALDSAMLARDLRRNMQNDGMIERAVGADRIGPQLRRCSGRGRPSATYSVLWSCESNTARGLTVS